MTKVFYLLLFLSSSTDPTYYNKGMYFMSEGECELSKPIAIEVKKLMNDKSFLFDVLSDGRKRAIEIATKTLNDVYDIVGLVRYDT